MEVFRHPFKSVVDNKRLVFLVVYFALTLCACTVCSLIDCFRLLRRIHSKQYNSLHAVFKDKVSLRGAPGGQALIAKGAIAVNLTDSSMKMS